MMRIASDALAPMLTDILSAAGAPAESAAQVASSLVESSLVGHDSHGVLRITSYVDAILGGRVDPHGAITVTRESATTAMIDGGRNLGLVVLRRAMALAMDKARAHDVAVVTVRNCGHTGRMGEYAVQAAREGFVATVLGTGSRKGGSVAPYGSVTPALNTNPMAWAVPSGRFPAVFLDFATSVVAWGKIEAAIDKGVPIPTGWILGPDGQPSTDPHDFQRGGVLLPFGGHKGSGLSFMVEALAGAMTGIGCAPLATYKSDFGTVLTALNVEAFQPLDEYRRTIDALVEAIKAGRPAPGATEVLVPGEFEWRTREERLRDGLALPEATWQRVVAAAERCGVPVPKVTPASE
jgi:LDH2 family malate/lactate/ureidoglycolate dehydrogenase